MRRIRFVCVSALVVGIAAFSVGLLSAERPDYSESIFLGFGIDGGAASSAKYEDFARMISEAIRSLSTNVNSIRVIEYGLLPAADRESVWGGVFLRRHDFKPSSYAVTVANGAQFTEARGDAGVPTASATMRGGREEAVITMMDAGIGLFDLKPFYSEGFVAAREGAELGPTWEADYFASMRYGQELSYLVRFGESVEPSTARGAPASSGSRYRDMVIRLDRPGASGSGHAYLFDEAGNKAIASVMELINIPPHERGAENAANRRKELLIVTDGYDVSDRGNIGTLRTEYEKLRANEMRVRIAVVDWLDSLAPFRAGGKGREAFFDDPRNYYMLLVLMGIEGLNESARPTFARLDLGNTTLPLPDGVEYKKETGTLICRRSGVMTDEVLSTLGGCAATMERQGWHGVARFLLLNAPMGNEARRRILEAWLENSAPYNLYRSKTLVAVDPPDWKSLFAAAVSDRAFVDAARRFSSLDLEDSASDWGRQRAAIIASASAPLWSPALSSRYAYEALSGPPSSRSGLPVFSVSVPYGAAAADGSAARLGGVAFWDGVEKPSTSEITAFDLSTGVLSDSIRRGMRRDAGILIAVLAILVILTVLSSSISGFVPKRLILVSRFVLIVALVSPFSLHRVADIAQGYGDRERLSAFGEALDVESRAASLSMADAEGTRKSKAAMLVADIARASNESLSNLSDLRSLMLWALLAASAAQAHSSAVRMSEIRLARKGYFTTFAFLVELMAMSVALATFYRRVLKPIPAERLGSFTGTDVLLAGAVGPIAVSMAAAAVVSLFIGVKANAVLKRAGYRQAGAPFFEQAARVCGGALLAQLAYLSLFRAAVGAYFDLGKTPSQYLIYVLGAAILLLLTVLFPRSTRKIDTATRSRAR